MADEELTYQQLLSAKADAGEELSLSEINSLGQEQETRGDFWQGLLGSVGSGATFNLADEAAAGIRSYLPGFQDYDSELAALRGGQKQFDERHRAMSVVGRVAGGLPAAFLTGPASTVAQMAKVGAVTNAAYGFGAGEDGLLNRMGNAAKDAFIGAVTTPVVSKTVQAITTPFKEAGQSLLRRSIGTRASDYAKEAKELGVGDIVDGDVASFTKQAINELQERGVLGDSVKAGKLLANMLQRKDEIGSRVGQIIDDFDAAGHPPITPTFDNAMDYIASGRIDARKADDLVNELLSLSDAIKQQGGGSLRYLQNQKTAYGGKYDQGDDALNGFYRAVTRDFKENVEKYVPEVLPLNKELQKLHVVDPILRRNMGKEEASNWVDSILQKLRTSGGTMTTPTMIGSLAGGSMGGPIGAVVGAGLGFASSPAGQHAVGNFLTGNPAVTTPIAKAVGSAMTGAGVFTPGEASASIPKSQDGLSVSIEPIGDTPQGKQLFSGSMPPRSTELPAAGGKAQSTQQFPYMPKLSKSDLSNVVSSVVPEKDRAIMMALIKQESGGNTTAVSKAGAKGLTQLMPAMAKAFGVQDVFDPVQNLQGGYALFQEERDRFKDIRLALAAYNAGSPRVRKAIEKADSRNFDEVQAHLPKETRDYVKRIMSALA